MARYTFIYFIQHGAGGPVKIGRSTDPLGRLANLQTAAPEPLTLAGVLKEDTGQSEQNIHRFFREDRLRGEWFRPTPRMAGYLQLRESEIQQAFKAAQKVHEVAHG